MYKNAFGTELKLSGSTNNWIANSAGNTTRSGSAYNDIFQGSAGDIMSGGGGDDQYNLWAPGKVIELAGNGTDTIYGQYWGGVTLPDNVENLFLMTNGSIFGIGNSLDNIIAAGAMGAKLDGLAGNDVLVGGSGADLFNVSAGNGSDAIMNFQAGWDMIGLEGYGFSNFNQIKSIASQTGADVSFSLGGGETLVLRDVKLADLDAADFGFALPTSVALGQTQLIGAAQCYNANGWYVLNNAWGSGGLVQGRDFTLNSSFDAHDMTKGTTFNWSYPYATGATQILAYPEVIFGVNPHGAYSGDPTDKANVFPVQVSNLVALTADYDVSYSGNSSGFNVSYDIWFTSKPNGDASTITNEVMVWLHKGALQPFGQVIGTYTDGTNTATIYHQDTYTAVVFDTDVLKGSLDLTKLLDKLQSLGVVSSTEYLASVELGAEVASGTGSLTINNLDLNVQSRGINGNIVTKEVTGSGTTVSETTPFHTGNEQVFDHSQLVGTKSTSIDASGIVTIQWFDTAWKLVKADSIKTDSKGQLTQHFDAAWKFLGADSTIANKDGSTTIQHFDATWKFLGADSAFANKDGSTTIQHFDATWKFVGAQSHSSDAHGVTADITYDEKWNTVDISYHGTSGSDTIGALGAVKTGVVGDHMSGLGGNDLYLVNNVADIVDESANSSSGTDTVRSIVSIDLSDTFHFMGQIENIELAGSANLNATGTNLANTITGNSGNNMINGGGGADTLAGGGGNDSFVFSSKLDSNSNVDHVTDFTNASNNNDIFRLSHQVFDRVAGVGALTADQFVSNVTGTAKDSNDHIIYNNKTGDLYYDANGNAAGGSVLFAHLDHVPTLTASDFFIV